MPISKTFSSGSWVSINSNSILSINTKYVINTTTNEIILTFPATLGEIEIYNYSNLTVLANLDGQKFNNLPITDGRIVFNGQRARFLYLNSTVGWISLDGVSAIAQRGYGFPLLQLQGSLTDSSGNNRNATVVSGATSPTITTGLNSKPALRFNGTNQELQVTPFLSSATGATLYIVFSPNNDDQYNLIKTANLDDYWRFSANGNGYFGTFRTARIDQYPASMPLSGNHLISLHATTGTYEVIQNGVSKGVQTGTFSGGDRFRIATSDKLYIGDISLILVYPYHTKTSADYSDITGKIRQDYPSLSFTP